MSGWSPARPERPAAPAARAVPPSGGALASALPVGPADGPGVPAAPRPARRRRRRRLSPRTRVISGFVLLAVVIGAITGVGTALTPAYGDLAPWKGVTIADVRTAPSPTGWRLDLARDLLPGIPTRCAEFRSSSATDPLIAVIADSPSLGSSGNCSPQTIHQVDATVGLLDPSTGTLRWSHDLSREFASTGPLTIDQAWVRLDAGRMLVSFTADGRFTLAVLSLRDGHLIEHVQAPEGSIGSGPLIEGDLVLYSVSASREGSANWTLVRLGDITAPIWTDLLPDQTGVVLLRSGVYTRVSGRSIRVDGRTGEVTPFGGGSVTLGALQEDGVDLFTSSVVTSGVAISAWNPDGTRRWTRGGLGDLVALTRDCLFVTLPGTSSITCLDRRTGATRWSRDLPSQGYPTGMLGQTSDDVAVFRSFGNHTELLMLDGSDGSTRFTVDLLPTSSIAAVSRTTGYLVSSSLSGSPIGFFAFDTRSGRVLWQRNALDDGDTEMWGGQLVSVSPTGVVRQLVDPPRQVLGR